MFPTTTLLFLASGALLAAAQTPSYIGQVLLQRTFYILSFFSFVILYDVMI
jgi:hypothetical protein